MIESRTKTTPASASTAIAARPTGNRRRPAASHQATNVQTDAATAISAIDHDHNVR